MRGTTTPWRSGRGGRGYRGNRGGRGGWGGRGGRGGGGDWAGQSTRALIKMAPPLPLGQLRETMTPDQITGNGDSQQNRFKISDYRLLGSYNWAGIEGQSILFPGKHSAFTPIVMYTNHKPGMPPAWNPPKVPTQLSQDAGEFFRDQNAARHPSHPMEPAAAIVLAQQPDFDSQSIDVFACTSTLGNLLRFLKSDKKPFRSTVEAVGRAVFLVRRENAPDGKMTDTDGNGPAGYGHTFPARYTKWHSCVKPSASHQRVVSYDFAGLKLAVRYEADGYLEEKLRDELLVAGDGTAEGDQRSEIPKIEGVQVRTAGRLIPQCAIFELKTRGYWKKHHDHLAEHMPRLWVAQIPFLVLAFHDQGEFKPEEIIVQNVESEAQKWQAENQELLQKFGNLLQKLTSMARDPAVGKFEVVYWPDSKLEIRQQGGTVSSPLPESLSRMWADHSDTASDSDVGGITLSDDEDHSDGPVGSDDDADDPPLDYTACSERCKYCGGCRYKAKES